MPRFINWSQWHEELKSETVEQRICLLSWTLESSFGDRKMKWHRLLTEKNMSSRIGNNVLISGPYGFCSYSKRQIMSWYTKTPLRFFEKKKKSKSFVFNANLFKLKTTVCFNRNRQLRFYFLFIFSIIGNSLFCNHQ